MPSEEPPAERAGLLRRLFDRGRRASAEEATPRDSAPNEPPSRAAVLRPTTREEPTVQLIPLRLAVLQAKTKDQIVSLSRLVYGREVGSRTSANAARILPRLVEDTSNGHDLTPTRGYPDGISLVVMDGETPVGRVQIRQNAVRSELGIEIAPEHQGKGYGLAATKEVLALVGYMGSAELDYAYDAHNLPSANIAERLAASTDSPIHGERFCWVSIPTEPFRNAVAEARFDDLPRRLAEAEKNVASSLEERVAALESRRQGKRPSQDPNQTDERAPRRPDREVADTGVETQSHVDAAAVDDPEVLSVDDPRTGSTSVGQRPEDVRAALPGGAGNAEPVSRDADVQDAGSPQPSTKRPPARRPVRLSSHGEDRDTGSSMTPPSLLASPGPDASNDLRGAEPTIDEIRTALPDVDKSLPDSTRSPTQTDGPDFGGV